jgi:transposase-like protein
VAALDYETFRSVVEYLPSEIRNRVVSTNSIERISRERKNKKWIAFNEDESLI